TFTLELATELYIAREALTSQRIGRGFQGHTWSQYCQEVGSSRKVVDEWLRRWFALEKGVTNVTPLPLPRGKYQVIYADPPWQYNNTGLGGSAESHYPTMSMDELCHLEVSNLAGDDAVLFLWVTSPFLGEGLWLCEAWGFEYKTNFIWIKDRPTYGKLGFYNYGQHEFLFTATMGSCLPDPRTLEPSVLFAPKREHSEKPEAVYEFIERMYPGPYIELFARKSRPNWAAWGTL
ncbi:unnamed protein product, partial [marine sediment metagenome]